MTSSTENKRLVTAQGLRARGNIAASILVVDLHGNIHIDAPERIDRGFESVKVYFRVMRNGNARKLGNGLHRQRRTAKRVGGVDFILPIPIDVHVRITHDRDERHFLFLGIDARENHGVASEGIPILGASLSLLRAVNTHEKDVERIARRLAAIQNGSKIVTDITRELAVQYANVCKSGSASADNERRKNGHDADENLFPTTLLRTRTSVLIASRTTRIRGVRRGFASRMRAPGVSASRIR